MASGFVYILHNPSFRADRYKVGMTTKTPEERAAQLSAETGVPTPYEVLYSRHVKDCKEVEGLVHRHLADRRLHPRKEFFEVPLRVLIDVLDQAAKEIGIVIEEGHRQKRPMLRDDESLLARGEELEVSSPARKAARDLTAGSSRQKTLDDHLAKADDQVKFAFRKLQEIVLGLDKAVREKSLTQNLAYEAPSGRNFLEIFVKRHELEVLLRPIEYSDPENLIERKPDTHGWTLDRSVRLKEPSDVDRVKAMIEQSFHDVAQ